jgi:hypothetical protein
MVGVLEEITLKSPNYRAALHAAIALGLLFGCQWRRASEHACWAPGIADCRTTAGSEKNWAHILDVTTISPMV